MTECLYFLWICTLYIIYIISEIIILSNNCIKVKMSKKKVIKTSCDTNVWLIGHQFLVLDKLSCSSCLPTVGLILRRLFYDLKTNEMELSQSCSNIIDEVLQIWFIANVSIIQKRNAIAKLNKLYTLMLTLG